MGILAISIFATGMYDDIVQTLTLKDFFSLVDYNFPLIKGQLKSE
jgi:hypothetical protein